MLCKPVVEIHDGRALHGVSIPVELKSVRVGVGVHGHFMAFLRKLMPDALDVGILLGVVVCDVVSLEEECAQDGASVVVPVLPEQVEDVLDAALTAGAGEAGICIVIKCDRDNLFHFIGLQAERRVCRWCSVHN